MTKFEQIGVNAQIDASSKEEAINSFSWSCRCCCTHGMKLDCDHCCIAYTHYQTMALLADMERQFHPQIENKTSEESSQSIDSVNEIST